MLRYGTTHLLTHHPPSPDTIKLANHFHGGKNNQIGSFELRADRIERTGHVCMELRSAASESETTKREFLIGLGR